MLILAGLPLAGSAIGGVVTASAAVADMSGTVFRDYDADGVRGAGEPGIAGVSVTAYDGSGGSFAASPTDASGAWVIAGLDGSYRVEFTWGQSYLKQSAQSSSPGGSGSAVQFADSGATNVDLALENPSDYCQSDPDLAVACFTQGMPDATARTAIHRVSWNTAATRTPLAEVADTFSIYGLAYRRSSRQLFSSEYLKRHAAQYEGAYRTGQIFVTDTGAPTANAVPFVNVNDLGIDVGDASSHLNIGPGSRGLAPTGTPQNDVASFAKAGKSGLMDMAITEDETATRTSRTSR